MCNDKELGQILLGQRSRSPAYTPDELAIMRRTADLLAEAISLAERLGNGPRR